jgi:hypothetical protein
VSTSKERATAAGAPSGQLSGVIILSSPDLAYQVFNFISGGGGDMVHRNIDFWIMISYYMTIYLCFVLFY